MTLEEAIKELETMNHDGFIITRYTEYEALNFASEALKRIKEIRPFGNNPGIYNLLGETE